MTSDDIFSYVAMATSVIIGAVVLWPHIFPKDKPEQPQTKPAQRKPTKPKPKPTKSPTNPETIKAMHEQADAVRELATALERKAQRISDPIKRAQIEKQAADNWVRFNKILDQIDKLTM
jgi:hypothetical protein